MKNNSNDKKHVSVDCTKLPCVVAELRHLPLGCYWTGSLHSIPLYTWQIHRERGPLRTTDGLLWFWFIFWPSTYISD